MRGRLGLGRDCRAVARGAARADVAQLPAHVGVVERVAPRPRLAVGIAAVVVAAQPALASWKQSLPSKRQASTLHAVSHMPSPSHPSGQPSLHNVSEYDALSVYPVYPESMTDCAAAAAKRTVYIVEDSFD